MKLIYLVALTMIIASNVYAEPVCTKEPQSAWKDEAAFKQSLVDQGYQIKKFKVTKGNCYEIYGWDKEKKRVEIYFNPVTGEIVKEERD